MADFGDGTAAAFVPGMRKIRRLCFAVLLASSLGGSGCGSSSLRPVAPVADGPAGVRVLLKNQSDEIFRLEVVNYGPSPIVVDRDRVYLYTANGPRQRVPGGVGNIYTVAPGGGHHALNLRFKLGGIQAGERVAISLAGAVSVNGQPLNVPPLEFVAD
ncbi:MAG: hypothetical protein JWN44_3409 [Myxococcales bacterium]|nr:hypothetical protein [Myxococcales bacterium]